MKIFYKDGSRKCSIKLNQLVNVQRVAYYIFILFKNQDLQVLSYETKELADKDFEDFGEALADERKSYMFKNGMVDYKVRELCFELKKYSS